MGSFLFRPDWDLATHNFPQMNSYSASRSTNLSSPSELTDLPSFPGVCVYFPESCERSCSQGSARALVCPPPSAGEELQMHLGPSTIHLCSLSLAQGPRDSKH